MLVMENINMTHVFKHPKFYKIPRDKKDQVISSKRRDGACERAPGPGLKREDSSDKQQAAEAQASSYKRSSHK